MSNQQHLTINQLLYNQPTLSTNITSSQHHHHQPKQPISINYPPNITRAIITNISTPVANNTVPTSNSNLYLHLTPAEPTHPALAKAPALLPILRSNPHPAEQSSTTASTHPATTNVPTNISHVAILAMAKTLMPLSLSMIQQFQPASPIS
jgi:hypothetical protein